MVYYYPEKELQGSHIGMFNTETIGDHQDRFLKGRGGAFTPKQPHTEFSLSDIDCSKPLVEASDEEDAAMQAEIMREIMEEEAQREKEREASERKRVVSGKKSKKGKKKSKQAKKDDL